MTAVKARAPVLGGNFGVWGGMFSTFDCAVKGVRKKEDPWNAIIAGFFTGGALAVRGGPRAIRNGAIGCAILLAVIEEDDGGKYTAGDAAASAAAEQYGE
ncbi:translocase of the inner membrane [Saxophila tyrrhenica]|uniref:Translocase of the inner membrane n=1 Tax=Saxophila tyrrhenica TaxID=1690608 RepID=A0AAV9P3A2_9PEZI|nr:translocase of the inner membrane [Saxophila tyrrhenica]